MYNTLYLGEVLSYIYSMISSKGLLLHITTGPEIPQYRKKQGRESFPERSWYGIRATFDTEVEIITPLNSIVFVMSQHE